MDLVSYMENGVKIIEKNVAKYYIKNLDGRKFLTSFIPALSKSSCRRHENAKHGLHVPMFLICSITSRCNLHCAGCYARAGGMCSDSATPNMLSGDEWTRVFFDAHGLGISFILLAGGEPLLRRDVLDAAASVKSICFPIFTNGMLLNDEYIDFFAKNRNLIPVLSIEGDSAATDARRGKGVADHIKHTIELLKQKGILFAVSTTVTKANLDSVVGDDYIQMLRSKGCGAAFFIEYVPAEPNTDHLILSEADSERLCNHVEELRNTIDDMCLFTFPGDEKYMEGCLAAGRGFFHINPVGGAEPCPFSPFSKLNIRDSSLSDVLSSDFFTEVQKIEQSDETHHGGCTLFNHREEVSALLSNK